MELAMRSDEDRRTTVVVFDPYVFGHSVHKLLFTVSEFRRLENVDVIPVGNKSALPSCDGILWRQCNIRHLPLIVFLRYMLILISVLRRARGRRVLFNNAFDSTWEYFVIFSPVIIPLFRLFRIDLFCLQFRTGYLTGAVSATDWAKRIAFLLLRAGLGSRFSLLATRPGAIGGWNNVRHLPDLMEIPGELVSREVARLHLGIGDHERVLLFFGNINDDRKGFHTVAEAVRILPPEWKIMVMSDGAGKYGDVLQQYRSRFIVQPADVEPGEKQFMFRAADAVVTPYAEEYGGSSGVMMDAVMFGIPVISTRFPYALEIFALYDVGILLPRCSAREIHDACIEIPGRDFQGALTQCREELKNRYRAVLRDIVE